MVADTVNHALRGVRLATGDGPDAGRHRPAAGCRATARGALSSPWDVAWWQDRVWVAMAGVHQLWTFDPRTGAVEVAAGTANEGLLDGPLAEAWFAQTSGLAAAGDRLWIADSETSSAALRRGRRGAHRRRHRAVRLRLPDGAADAALLQHPLGVTVLPDGSVAVCDTYNGAVRRWDPDGAGHHDRHRAGRAERRGASTATTWSSWSRPRTG